MPNIEDKKRAGMFLGGLAPYGYRKDPENPGRLIVDEDAAQVVRDIFKWYTSNKMYVSDITRKLNDLEIPSPLALVKVGPHPETKDRYIALWSQSTVISILKNQVYLGHMIQGRFARKSVNNAKRRVLPENEWIIVKNTHEPIIGQSTFELAQRRFSANRDHRQEKRGDNEFAGFLRCPDCGFAMSRTGHSCEKDNYFQCSTYRARSKTACTRHGIRLMDLRECVLKEIKKQTELAQTLYDKMDELCGTPKILDEIKRLNTVIHGCEKEYERKISRRAELHIELSGGKIEQKAYDRKKSTLNKRLKALEDAIDALRGDRDTASKGIDLAQTHLGIFLKYNAITELNRNMLVDLVDVIYVYEGGEVEVNFLNNDGIKVVRDFIGRF